MRPAARSSVEPAICRSRSPRSRKGEAKGPVRPGEEVEVTITTTDPQGKPVAAEVSLAMVEQSLLERFPDGCRRSRTSSAAHCGSRRSAPRRASPSPITRPRSRSIRGCWPRKTGWKSPARKRKSASGRGRRGSRRLLLILLRRRSQARPASKASVPSDSSA